MNSTTEPLCQTAMAFEFFFLHSSSSRNLNMTSFLPNKKGTIILKSVPEGISQFIYQDIVTNLIDGFSSNCSSVNRGLS